MALELYRKKRNFSTTPEPAGRVGRRKAQGLVYVIQKHAASHLHYDFRLESNGVLLSWAVPKGPSLDPNDKRLAMHVEDHPLEYGGFEGVIPPRQYGSGTVLLWDRGIWTPKGDPDEGYRKGKLKFTLDGEKLHGGWTLVRTFGSKYGRDGKSWLLIKEDDEYAQPAHEGSVVDEHPNSVASGRSLEDIAADADRVWHSNKSVADNVKAGAVRSRRSRAVANPAGIEGAVKSALPGFVEPQLATLVDEPPRGEGWVHEMKLDGYRILCRIENGEARLYSRTGKEWTADFPTIAKAAARLPAATAWLDGEVVVLQADGRSSFQALQNVLSSADGGDLHYYVFDLPYLDGHDLRKSPLLERKRLLAKLAGGRQKTIRMSEHVAASGAEYYGEACKLGLEGIISKRADAPYQAGRGRAWVKVKCEMRQEMVIGGYTDPEGARVGLGALLLGVYDADGSLRYSGKVGTGFDDATLKTLRKKLDERLQQEPPFVNPPRGAEARRSHWVRPDLVAEVRFTEWTADGTLRHPSFQGLREDKPAREVVRERPAPAAVAATKPAARAPARGGKAGTAKTRGGEQGTARARGGKEGAAKTSGGKEGAAKTSGGKAGAAKTSGGKAGAAKTSGGRRTAKARDSKTVTGAAPGNTVTVAGISLSNAGKLLYPEAGLSKRDLAAYYEAVADWILPHLKDRPLTLVRCPNGWDKQCFYQKNADDSVDEAIERVTVQTSEGPGRYMTANSLPALVALVQMGVLEIHPWGSTRRKLGCADRIVFDFDPDDDLEWRQVVEAVELMRTLLQEIGLEGYLKTTGGKGLHVVLPIQPKLAWSQAKGFSKAVAELMCRTFPDRFTDKITKSRRRGKIFIDYLRNAEGATAIAAYAVRARARAPVAMPIAWEEVEREVRFDHFNVKNVPARLARLKHDPWQDFFERRQSVTKAMMKKVGYAPPPEDR